MTLDANIWRPLTPTLWTAGRSMEFQKGALKKFGICYHVSWNRVESSCCSPGAASSAPPSNRLFPLQTTFSDLICLICLIWQIICGEAPARRTVRCVICFNSYFLVTGHFTEKCESRILEYGIYQHPLECHNSKPKADYALYNGPWAKTLLRFLWRLILQSHNL